ncbi:D-alanyl-D-alanine carboxypeptidase [Ancylobacter sp. WKF20]|uniref:D-alanyl-D-alanine carboxypeptidase family protein n=1 Tax=Ancylobacter sp. WKF20 TaxID=3039801 RepID=UPI002434199A|nr:D-alanyl-D-alanine carboxypeptidase [Ancylobacter sp. WKF20]WGD28888.1 D-alanyl-D-alanine carboxypeptidase [Ancylobacter sp. WKF20]
MTHSSLSRARPARLGGFAFPLMLALALAPLAFATAARATPALVVEVDSGKVLMAEDATKPWYPASVTKLMTAYVTLKAIRAGRVTPQTLVTVTETASAQQPSKMGFKVGTQVTVDNALKMMLVKSANDMAVVLAEGVGGNYASFIAEMNASARELGMDGTHYANPNGLPDPNQVTTARDLAILTRAILTEFPEQSELFRIPAIKLGNAVIRNYNKLIDRYPGADGMKTGFICASGFNLVATAHRGDKRLIAVVLGTNSGKDRTEQAALLLEKGFQHSWKIFGAVSPTVDSLRNEGGTPTDMRAQVCGGKRKNTASEADDDSGPAATSFVAAGMGSLGDNVTGASLLQKLPPSMPPVEVFVGPFPSAEALAAAYPPPPEKKKPVAAKDKPAAKKKPGPTTAVIDASPLPAPKPAGKPAAAKPAAKPASKPAAAPLPNPAAATTYPTVPPPPQ